MSDDEYYANSAYDDFEDYLWDDNVSEDPADNLAEHTLPSPIYQEDPHYETREAYSDWDYYSDDYFDDDPSLLKHDADHDSTSGPPRRAQRPTRQSQEAKRGKKRKLQEIDNIPVLDLTEKGELEKCIKGVVWARPPPQVPLAEYQEGQNKRVALMKDWKEMFHEHAPTTKKRKVLNDESWANDLSLEDMGLKSVKEQGITRDGVGIELAEDDDEQMVRTMDDENDHVLETDDEPTSIGYPLRGTRGVPGISTRPVPVTHQPTTDLPSSLRSSESIAPESVVTDRHAIAGEPNKARKMANISNGRRSNGDVAHPEVNRAVSPTVTEMPRHSKKRKADVENDDAVRNNAIASTASSRAKRAASSKLASARHPLEDKAALHPVAKTRKVENT